MKKSKALLLALCAAALSVGATFGTMAYLTDKDAATNTFTVGHVDILLDEKNVDGKDAEGKDNADELRDKANKYHLIPGQTYEKDPTVTVKKDSEEAFIYMTVTVKDFDQLTSALPGSSYYHNGVFLIQNLCNWQADSPWAYRGFKQVDADTGEYRFVYTENGKEKKVAGGDNGVTLPALFDTITVPGADITSNNIDNLKNVEIVVNAYAIQGAGFDTADAAWAAAIGNGDNYTIN